MSAQAEPQLGRTEVDVAADAVWALVVAGLIPRSGEAVARAAAAVRVPVAAVRDASRRRDRGWYQPPRLVVVAPAEVWPGPAAPSGDAVVRPLRADAGGSHVVSDEGRRRMAVRSRQPAPEATTMRCRRCHVEKALAVFSLRSDRPGKRWTTCDPCRAEQQRERYLSVKKRKALNAADLTFVLVDGEQVGLACSHCGLPLAAGDEVTGTASLAHTRCPEPRHRPGMRPVR